MDDDKEYIPKKRRRASGSNYIVESPSHLIERRTKIKFSSEKEEKSPNYIILPQYSDSEKDSVYLEDIALLSKEEDAKNITILFDHGDLDGRETYFRDVTNFYSWKKQHNIDLNFTDFKSNQMFHSINRDNLLDETILTFNIIESIKKKYSKPKVDVEKVKKIPIPERVHKFKRSYISENIKRYIIKNMDEGKKPDEIASKIKLKPKQINYIYNYRKKYPKSIKKSIKKYRKITEEHVNFVKDLISKKECVINDVVNEIKNQDDLPNLEYNSCRIILKNELECSNKDSICYHPNRYVESTRIERKDKYKFLKENIDKKIIIFIDESGYNTNMRPKKSWQPKGKRRVFPGSRIPNASLICAISKEFGVMGAQVLNSGTHKEDYTGFISNLIRTWDLASLDKDVILFHDNLKVHYMAHKLINDLGLDSIKSVFNATYSPMINPIEHFFAFHKRIVRKSLPMTTKDLLKKIFKALDLITYEMVNNVINHIFSLEESIMNLEII